MLILGHLGMRFHKDFPNRKQSLVARFRLLDPAGIIIDEAQVATSDGQHTLIFGDLGMLFHQDLPNCESGDVGRFRFLGSARISIDGGQAVMEGC